MDRARNLGGPLPTSQLGGGYASFASPKETGKGGTQAPPHRWPMETRMLPLCAERWTSTSEISIKVVTADTMEGQLGSRGMTDLGDHRHATGVDPRVEPSGPTRGTTTRPPTILSMFLSQEHGGTVVTALHAEAEGVVEAGSLAANPGL